MTTDRASADDRRATRDETSPYERIITGENTVLPKPEPLHTDTPRIILIGTAIWALALVVVLLVPTLHSGSRHWWSWTCLAGVVLGLLGFAYVRRGRGNAEAA